MVRTTRVTPLTRLLSDSSNLAEGSVKTPLAPTLCECCWQPIDGEQFTVDELTMCKSGASCHDAAPLGSKSGTQALKNTIEKAKIPVMLCEHIVAICEE